jgi:flagellar FliL protein
MKVPLPILVLLVLNLLGLGVVGGLIYMSHKKEAAKMTMTDVVRGVEEEKEAKENGLADEHSSEAQENPMYELDAFTVNLSDPKTARYVKTTIKLELSNMEVEDELERRTPQVRDLIIILLSSKTYDEMQTTEGKNKLRDEIIKSVNSYLVKGEVKNLFFTNFVIN